MSAADYFLKIDGVDGESIDDKHKGSIELESFSWGATHLNYLSDAALAHEFDMMAGAGAHWIRIDINWAVIQAIKHSPFVTDAVSNYQAWEKKFDQPAVAA